MQSLLNQIHHRHFFAKAIRHLQTNVVLKSSKYININCQIDSLPNSLGPTPRRTSVSPRRGHSSQYICSEKKQIMPTWQELCSVMRKSHKQTSLIEDDFATLATRHISNIIHESPKSDGCAIEVRGRGKGMQMVADPRHLQEPNLVTLHLKTCG